MKTKTQTFLHKKRAEPKSQKSRITTQPKKMDAQKVDMYIMTNGKFFESIHIAQIRERLLSLDENKWGMIQAAPMKDPQTALIISIFLGTYGIDRFYIGDTGLGVGKLLTCGGAGIWAIIDWFGIQKATREKNFDKLQQFLY